MEDLVNSLRSYDEAYYNGEKPLVSDTTYDLLRDKLWKMNPSHEYFKNGKDNAHQNVNVTDDRKTTLPFYMGSMNKYKTENDISKWRKKFQGPLVISDKLDGVSGMAVYKNGKLFAIYTRGNGTVGQNVTHSIRGKLAKGLPLVLDINNNTDIVIRGEFIMSKASFKDYSAKTHTKTTNARNTVSGAIIAKKPNPDVLQKIDFVAYEVVSPPIQAKIQMDFLNSIASQGISPVHVTDADADADLKSTLSGILQKRYDNSIYDIDGIIITSNKDSHKRTLDGNPAFSFAYKEDMNHQRKTTIIKSIEWEISKNAILVPVAHVEPVFVAGVMISKVSAHNARNVVSNGLGPGAKVIIIRSGEVIPKIETVISPSSKLEEAMPQSIGYKWDKNEVNIVFDGDATDNSEYMAKQISNFFEKIKVQGIKIKTAMKLVNGGFRTIASVLKAKKDELVPIVGESLATKVVKGSDIAYNHTSCVAIMDASNAFGKGLGSSRMEAIARVVDPVKSGKMSERKMMELIIAIPGVKNAIAQIYIDGLPKFHAFLKETGISIKNECVSVPAKVVERKEKGVLFGQVITFSGMRPNNDLERQIMEADGTVSDVLRIKDKDSTTKATTMLVVKDKSKSTKKIKTANEAGIQILNIVDLEEKISK